MAKTGTQIRTQVLDLSNDCYNSDMDSRSAPGRVGAASRQLLRGLIAN